MSRAMPAPGGRATFRAAPLDRPTRVATLGFVLLVAVLLPALLAVLAEEGARVVTALVLGAAGGALVMAAWGAGAAAYTVEGEVLRVRRRLLADRTYRLTGQARRASATLGLGLRPGGTGGLFGWSGTSTRPGLGRYRAYLTDRSRIVSCETDAGLVVVSPADPDRFCEAVRKARR